MGMPATSKRWTAAEVREMQDEFRAWPRYELIDGELLVTPSPGSVHQVGAFGLARKLADYCDAHRLGQVILSPADLELEPGTITQPDVFIVPAGTSAKHKGPLEWSDIRSLLLAVEWLSPSSVRTDRTTKRAFYLRAGVPEYWVVDADARAVERWTEKMEHAEIVASVLAWQPRGAAATFELELGPFFDDVLRRARNLP